MTTDLAEPLPMLWGDDASLQRVLINLLDNAVNASKEGGKVKVAARAISADAKHPGIQIKITDDGAGIPPELLPKMTTRIGASATFGIDCVSTSSG